MRIRSRVSAGTVAVVVVLRAALALVSRGAVGKDTGSKGKNTGLGRVGVDTPLVASLPPRSK